MIAKFLMLTMMVLPAGCAATFLWASFAVHPAHLILGIPFTAATILAVCAILDIDLT